MGIIAPGSDSASIARQPVAVRVSGDPAAANNGMHYLYADHLGGINAIQRQNGVLEQMRYTPFGAYRQGGPSPITDRAFTGQKENMGLGLYYYNARFYAPGIGRFLSADTIVPDPQNPQQFNRYAYSLNSPLSYSDPTGHCVQYGGESGNPEELAACLYTWQALGKYYGNTTGYGDSYPNEYMNWLLENATTEEIVGILNGFGVEYDSLQNNSENSNYTWLPDYIALSGSYSFGAGVNTGVIIDLYGNVYFSIGGEARK